MRPWWEELFSFLAGLLTKQDLAAAGAAPETLKHSVTFSKLLPTFGSSVESDEHDKRLILVTFMRTQLGKKYHLGVEVPAGKETDTEEWDCSEITEAAYRAAALPLPDGARFQFDACQPIISPKPGDLGFLWSDKRSMIGHVMMYAGDGFLIHAAGGKGVVEEPADPWVIHPRWRGWRRHVDFIRAKEDRA